MASRAFPLVTLLGVGINQVFLSRGVGIVMSSERQK